MNTALQNKVISLGVCPQCHTKSLKIDAEFSGTWWYICKRCKHIYILSKRYKDPTKR